MSSRRSVRKALVAVLLGVLVGGGLMAVTPAGAQVSSAAGTSWKKIWKKNLKPLATKSFYTKRQTKARFQTKGDYEVAGSGYSKTESDAKYAGAGSGYGKAESDARYAGAGSGYSKAESDARYAPAQPLYRGTYFMSAGAGDVATTSIAFGATFPSEPAVHFIRAGGAVPPGCSGTSAAPNAAPGNLCVFEYSSSLGAAAIVKHNILTGADVFGAAIYAFAGASRGEGLGSWAARPSGAVTNPAFTPPRTGATNDSAGGGRAPVAGRD